ncbi:hypothetical protein TIFTF001_027107 [Ficus carica]|uniref:NLP1-9 GAF domain-containing protein n=1 Tax=Ficus carica TaxID=3494 RepID=A0AA88IXZ8_FICCA|nr:hypothetical protein TIFTF001_027107 [Ficus carica]
MPLFQQGLTEKDYQEFKDEISDILDYAFNTHKLPMVRAWVPCVLSRACEDGQLGLHRNSVSILDVQYTKYLFISFHLNRALPLVHLERGEGIVGKAFMTNQAFFSPTIAFSSNPKDPMYHDAHMFGLHDAAVAVPLRSSIHNSECVLEFLLPSNCADLEERRKLVTVLFSTLEQCCKTLRVVADKVLKEHSISPFLAFKPLQPFDVAEQSFVNDRLFQKENPREATPKRVMQLLPESSDQNEKRPDPTPRIEPAEMFDAIGLGSLAASETSEERHATGVKTVNVHISLNDSTKNTGGNKLF